ncbi:MAG: hypothetical protein NWE88_11855 [Candidatus Bathyarchaeota archaeon]|nr:hypothetical protein [Candidatus Bathyarchaeota archaeon]
MVENSLHEGVKRWYAEPGDLIEENVEGYIVDVVRGEQLIEIQTSNFSAIKKKLAKLVRHHRVRLVHPVSQRKWIVRIDANGEMVSRRRSPRRGRVEDVFLELVYMPYLMKEPNFSLEVLLVHSEEVLIDDGRGSWRRRGWSIHDRRLLEVMESHIFSEPRDFLRLLPKSLRPEFTTRQLSETLGLRLNIAQKMVYSLRNMGAIEAIGKRGRAPIYTVRN